MSVPVVPVFSIITPSSFAGWGCSGVMITSSDLGLMTSTPRTLMILFSLTAVI